MRLVFEKEIELLYEKTGVKLPRESCFMENMIVYSYNAFFMKQPMVRFRAQDGELKVVKTYEYNPPVSWQEVVASRKSYLEKLEEKSLALIRISLDSFPEHKPLILTSGGKDSSVTMHLVRQILPECPGRFDNTSMDVADTYKHIKSIDNVEIANPEKGFYQWQREENFIPTRFARSCCRIFKEGQMISDISAEAKMLFFMGMRNDESATRKDYKDLWVNEKWGKRDWQALLPIRHWSEEDIWLYILLRDIPINEKYTKGYARVGCAIACPFYSQYTWVLDAHWYPKQYQRWHRILEQDFLQNKKWTKLNCTLEEYHFHWNGGMVREEATKEVIDEFSQFSGLSTEMASRYFEQTCIACGKKLNKDDVGLSMKFIGRNAKSFFCQKCLCLKFGFAKAVVSEYLEQFKASGCSLF